MVSLHHTLDNNGIHNCPVCGYATRASKMLAERQFRASALRFRAVFVPERAFHMHTPHRWDNNTHLRSGAHAHSFADLKDLKYKQNQIDILF